MMNKDALLMAQKFCAAEKKIAEERGGFYLFGIFERPQSPGRWDLVAAAPWLKTDRDGTKELIVLLRDRMDTADWKIIVGVFPIDPAGEYVEWITDKYDLQHQVQEVFDPGLSEDSLGHAFLITADKSPAAIMPQAVAA